MNKKIYKILVLFFIGSFGLIAQSQKKYQKTFPVDKNTSLLFQTHNIDVTFKLWDKDEVKIDFNVDFKNYSEEEIKTISNDIMVVSTRESAMSDANYLEIKNVSPISIAKRSYKINSGEIRIEDMTWDKSNSVPNSHRSVADINREISKKSKGFEEFKGYIIFENDSVALKNIDKSPKKEIQSIRSTYEIYVPRYMNLGLSVYNANINFEGKFTSKISAVYQDSTIEASELVNKSNVFSFVNGTVKIKKIVGGNYSFKNVNNVLIGQLENIDLVTEFSTLTFGEIIKNVRLIDFKSDLYVYNMGKSFESIKMQCEYSDIKLFLDKKDDMYMEAIGHNAIMKDGDMKIGLQPNREGKKHKMFTRGTKETASNIFMLDLVHGFITLNYIN